VFENCMCQRKTCQAVFNNMNAETSERGMSAVFKSFLKIGFQFVIKNVYEENFCYYSWN